MEACKIIVNEAIYEELIVGDEYHALRQELAGRPQQSSPTRRSAAYHSDIELVGRSQACIEVMKQVGRVANTNLPVLLTGESGTGKELVASAIHHQSDRSEQPFVAVNCGAIPGDLIAAELFGHVKGSFTGADRDQRGLWEEADGGTVFLNEITETNLAFQVKLMRALETGEIQCVGSNQTQKVNVRVIAASNRNVEQEVTAGRFHKDLFYRLNAVSIVLPPLRERREEGANQPVNGTSPVVLPTAGPAIEDWVTLSEIEGRYVARVLEHTGGNKQAAARVLSVDRKTLDRMIKRHNLNSHYTRISRVKVSRRA